MSRMTILLGGAVALLALGNANAFAQGLGVFTAQQASAGRTVYMGNLFVGGGDAFGGSGHLGYAALIGYEIWMLKSASELPIL